MADGAPASEDGVYSWRYETTDELGNTHGRTENRDANGVVTGSDFYILTNGVYRSRNYVANDFGFFVKILSNEPGLGDEDPGHVIITKEKVPEGVQPDRRR